MTQIAPQPGILEISLYQGGRATLPGRDDVLKLSSNENPFGPPQSAKDAAARAVHDMHRYPSTDHGPLRAAIAGAWSLDAERIICGVGSDEILTFLCQAYAGPGDEIIHTEHGFSLYPILAHAAGATPVKVPERDRVVDVDAILAAITQRTRLILLTNPGNPTGTMLPRSELSRLAQNVPPSCLLVLDGAYAEFAEGFDGGVDLVEAHENVVMTRTFSKIYGLGGLRVGWGYGPAPVIDVLNRIRPPFNLSVIALAAAEAAVRDTAWLEKCRSENARMRDWLTAQMREMGVAVDDSHANFVLARFGTEAEATACNDHFNQAGIIVRQVGGYGFPNGLRITVGDESGCRRVAHALAQFRGLR